MSQEELSDELAHMEAALSTVGPRPSGLDRDRVMYLAGRASATAERPRRTPRRWLWPTAFGAMTTVAATLLVMVLLQPGTEIVNRVQEPSARQYEVEKGEALASPEIEQPSSQRVWGGLADKDRERRLLESPYFRDLDRIIALGPDPWTSVDSSATAPRQTVPLKPYPQFLESLLDHPVIGEPPRPSPRESFLNPGVES